MIYKKKVEKWNKDLNNISTTMGEIKQYLKKNNLTLEQLMNEGLVDPISKIESINGKIEFLKGIRNEKFHFRLHALYDDDINYYKNELNNIKDVYCDIISPLFTEKHINEECEAIEKATYEQCLKNNDCNEYNYDNVGEYCAEIAFDTAERKAIFLYLMKYVNRCLWISGLAQTWEQQLIRFHNETLLQNKKSNLKFEDIKQSFKINFYDFEEFESYGDLVELRHVVNAIKHGEGSSAKKLRKICPKYFETPSFWNKDKLYYHKTVLLDETLFISDQDFQRYFFSLISFWEEMLEKNKEIWETKKQIEENLE